MSEKLEQLMEELIVKTDQNLRTNIQHFEKFELVARGLLQALVLGLPILDKMSKAPVAPPVPVFNPGTVPPFNPPATPPATGIPGFPGTGSGGGDGKAAIFSLIASIDWASLLGDDDDDGGEGCGHGCCGGGHGCCGGHVCCSGGVIPTEILNTEGMQTAGTDSMLKNKYLKVMEDVHNSSNKNPSKDALESLLKKLGDVK